MKKKLIGIVVVLAMAFSLSTVALAAEDVFVDLDPDDVVVLDDTGVELAGVVTPLPPGQSSSDEILFGIDGWDAQGDPIFNDFLPGLWAYAFIVEDIFDFDNAIIQLSLGQVQTTHTGVGQVGFQSDLLSDGDIVHIMQYFYDGGLLTSGWMNLGTATLGADGFWWFDVADFGIWSLFFALIDSGMLWGDAVSYVTSVLGATSPATGDSTLSMVVIALVALSALGLATFSVAKARKEMI